jgi:uncharacterized damage-inducible protein DinB
MEPVKWFDRKFNFDFKENIFPEILQRLKETPPHLTNTIKSIPDELLRAQLDGKWSIKENIGHLTDLEPLWQLRLNDILSGAAEMHPADLSNTKTHRADHNSRTAEELLRDFSTIRYQTVGMLENIPEEIIFRSSLHPRLKTPMRTMDLFLFVAEHDDHHLSTITSIVNRLCKTV